MIVKYWNGVVCKKYSDCKTIKVQVARSFPHPKYGKIITIKKKFLVDVEIDVCNKLTIGDQIICQECNKVSKMKSKKFVDFARPKSKQSGDLANMGAK